MTRFNIFAKPFAVLMVVLVAVVMAGGGFAHAAFLGGLDLSTTSSTFQTGVTTALPTIGWTNVISSARVFDQLGPPNDNGLLIHLNGRFTDYRVQYDTDFFVVGGVAIEPNTEYTLSFDMGYGTTTTGGFSGYSFTLGTLDGGGTFTPLGTPATGNVVGLGSLHQGVVSASDQQIFTTTGTVSGDRLGVQWAQTSSTGGNPDFFGIDNVTLDATVIPEPSAIALGMLGLLSLCSVGRRRRARS